MSRRSLVHAVVLAVAVPASVRADLAGHVTATASGDPVAGARVSVRGGATTTSDADGAFMLPAADGTAVTVVAAHAGYFNNWVVTTGPQAALALALDAVPADDDPAYTFTSPETCAVCHPEQYSDWSGSPMALAGVNTWVHDLYDGSGTPGGTNSFVYTRDSVHAAANRASECASCHQPLGWARAPYTALEPLDAGTAAVSHGVACDLCHRVAAIDVTRSNFPGIWPGVVRLARTNPSMPVEFGVLGDTAFQSAVMRPAYQPQLTADVCAACHQDKNDPDEDGDFEQANGVISEPTYLEWKASNYADPTSAEPRTCVDCHMGRRDDLTSACTVQALPPRAAGQIRSHRIEGTTAAMLEHAVSAAVTVERVDGELMVMATVHNSQTGHHVPTGVTVRNVILRVEAFGPDGAVLAPTGGEVIGDLGGIGDPAQGYWAGLPGKLFAKIPADAAGHAPVFYTEATQLASDSRIPAGVSDTTHYTFALPTMPGQVRVVTRVVYRRAFRALVDAKGWTTDGHGGPLEDLAAPDFGHVMAKAEATMMLTDADLSSSSSGCCQTGRHDGGGAVVLAGLTLFALRRSRARTRVVRIS